MGKLNLRIKVREIAKYYSVSTELLCIYFYMQPVASEN
jgi:hypothetical protein